MIDGNIHCNKVVIFASVSNCKERKQQTTVTTAMSASSIESTFTASAGAVAHRSSLESPRAIHRLHSIEIQCIMQFLDPSSLLVLSRTCRSMRIVAASTFSWRHSWLRVSINHLRQSTPPSLASLLLPFSSFPFIHVELDLECDTDPSHADLLAISHYPIVRLSNYISRRRRTMSTAALVSLLALPSIQQSVTEFVGVSILEEAIMTAICSLPHLAVLDMRILGATFDDRSLLQPLSLCTSLTTLTIGLHLIWSHSSLASLPSSALNSTLKMLSVYGVNEETRRKIPTAAEIRQVFPSLQSLIMDRREMISKEEEQQ